MTKILITRCLPDSAITKLNEHFEVDMWPHEETPIPREELLDKVADVDAILCMLTETIDEEVFKRAPNLKIVANMAVGFDNIDVEAAKKRGVTVTNTPDVLNETTADLTFALLLATARRIPEAVDFVKQDQWTTWSPFLLAGSDVHHKTLGIVGMGNIGQAVAKRATGFNMNILYHNRSRKKDAEAELGTTYAEFDELIERSDFVVCMTPLTDETKNMFNADVFKSMKNSAIFINSSRGGVVNEEDLVKALADGEIKAAGLDVFKNEPIKSDYPLLNLNNVVALPHIGSASVDTRMKMVELAVDNIVRVLDGDDPVTPVY